MKKCHGSAWRSLLVIALSCLLLSMAGLWHAFADEPVAESATANAGNDTTEPSQAEQHKSAFRQLLFPRETTPQQQPEGIALFGTVEFKGTLDALPKWKRVLNRMDAFDQMLSPALGSVRGTRSDTTEQKIDSARATPNNGGQSQKTGSNKNTNGNTTHTKAWKQFASSLKNKNTMEKLRAVNAYFNKWPYRLDMENWGVSDYWAAPDEFINKSGDCEDYSIIKYYALKELGFAPETMRIVALRDTIRGIGHAVLVVYAQDDAWVLDNQTNLVLSHSRYGHYQPQYSVNETTRWAHIPKQKKSLGSIFSQAKKKQ